MKLFTKLVLFALVTCAAQVGLEASLRGKREAPVVAAQQKLPTQRAEQALLSVPASVISRYTMAYIFSQPDPLAAIQTKKILDRFASFLDTQIVEKGLPLAYAASGLVVRAAVATCKAMLNNYGIKIS